ncbi:hypothetical protein PACTADRAFT_48142, partial [Pachysolen tannophilus NRRL Y-2460]
MKRIWRKERRRSGGADAALPGLQDRDNSTNDLNAAGNGNSNNGSHGFNHKSSYGTISSLTRNKDDNRFIGKIPEDNVEDEESTDVENDEKIVIDDIVDTSINTDDIQGNISRSTINFNDSSLTRADSKKMPPTPAPSASSVIVHSQLSTSSSSFNNQFQGVGGVGGGGGGNKIQQTSQRRTLSTKPSKSNLRSKSSTANMQSLVKPDWDSKIIKVGWLNRSINDKGDFDEDHLKLYRAELKGAYLYLYKPPSELYNVKRFAIAEETPQQLQLQLQAQAQAQASQQASAPSPAPALQPAQPEQESGITNSGSSSFLKVTPASSNTVLASQDSTSLGVPSIVGSYDNESTCTIFEENNHIHNINNDDSKSIKSKKSFPSLPNFVNSTNNNSQDSLSIGSSTSPSKNSITNKSSTMSLVNTSNGNKAPVQIEYFQAKYPHPKLVLEPGTQTILSGNLESVCHAILFNTYVSKDGSGDNNKISKHLLSLLPLLDDINSALYIFKRYLDVFTKEPLTDSSVRNSMLTNKENLENHDVSVMIPYQTERIMTKRSFLVVEYIKDNFCGMLLDNVIFKSIWDLLLSIDSHENSDELKKAVHLKQQQLYSLLNQDDLEDINTVIIDELNVDKFINMDLKNLAREINLINLKFNKVWNPQIDSSLLFEPIQESYSYVRKNPLIFNSQSNIHYLGRLFVNQLFGDSTVTKDAAKRADIITRWVELGSYFDKIGDMVSWLSVATLICSIPILRLQKTWDLVNPELIKTISNDWAPVVFELDRRSMISDASHRSSYHVIAPQGIGQLYDKENVIPYFGDLYVKRQPDLSIRQVEKKTQRVNISLERWRDYVSNVKNAKDFKAIAAEENFESSPKLSRLLYNLLNFHLSRPPLTLDTVMSYSLTAEPETNGKYNQYHDTARSPLFLGSYPSVIFPETLPKYHVYDQKALIGAIGSDGVSNSSVYNSTFSNVINSKQSDNGTDDNDTKVGFPTFQQTERKLGRNQFLKNLRDFFNIDSFELHVHDSIIFKTMIGEENNEMITTEYDGESGDNTLEGSPDVSTATTSSLTTTSVVLSTAPPDHITNSLDTKPHSRPSSVLFNESANTKRYSNYSSNLDYAERAAIPDQKAPFISEIFTKAATLERLIDLLVLTSNIFGSEINKEDVNKYFAKVNKLPSNKKNNKPSTSFKMDNGVFTVTFFATYRGFCSTTTLLEGLLSRFIGAKSAALSISKRREYLANTSIKHEPITDDYPSWSDVITEDHPDYDKISWKYVSQIQIGILEALIILVKDHYDHFTDVLKNKQLFVEILKIVDNEVIIEWTKVLNSLEQKSTDDMKLIDTYRELRSYYEQILTLYKKLRKVYIKKSYGPLISDVKVPVFKSILSELKDEWNLPDSKSISQIEDFVEEFDETVGNLFKKSSVNDWLNVFEIIEIQSSKSITGLFNYQMQPLSISKENLIISNVFTWLQGLYDVDDLGLYKEYVLNKFPVSVKSVFQLYYKFRNYLISQIVDPTITQMTRVDRMSTILQMLIIARLKMKSLDLFEPTQETSDISPHVPSLIESVLINSILSVESRSFSQSWIIASNSLNNLGETSNAFETLESLLPNSSEIEEKLSNLKKPLTPCIGWLLERLLEIACYIPNMSVENTKLINFDKRRYVYNCIANIIDMKDQQSNSVDSGFENHFFNFLFDLKDDLLFTREAILEAASKENKETLKDVENLKYERVVLFKQLIDEGLKILKREHAKKTFLSKQEQDRKNAILQETMITSPIHTRLSHMNTNATSTSSMISSSHARNLRRQSINDTSVNNTPSKSHGNRLKALFNKQSRPFSFSIGGFNNQPAPERIINATELPDARNYVDPKLKPNLIINLKELNIFPVYRIVAGFKINSHSDVEYGFQATSDIEKEDWIFKANYSKNHWFYSKSLNNKSIASQYLIFGVPIEYVCNREKSLIPNIIEKLLAEIEVRGLEEIGIYRKSASLSVLNILKTEVDKYGDFNMENHLIFDINNATGCIKAYLRELPDSLIPDELIPQFGKARDMSLDIDQRCALYSETVKKIPFYNYQLLKRLIRHLKIVDDYKEYNKMNASNLATILGATFIENARPDLSKKYFGLMNFVCEDMI